MPEIRTYSLGLRCADDVLDVTSQIGCGHPQHCVQYASVSFRADGPSDPSRQTANGRCVGKPMHQGFRTLSHSDRV